MPFASSLQIKAARTEIKALIANTFASTSKENTLDAFKYTIRSVSNSNLSNVEKTIFAFKSDQHVANQCFCKNVDYTAFRSRIEQIAKANNIRVTSSLIISPHKLAADGKLHC